MAKAKKVFGYTSWPELLKYGGGFVQALAMAIQRADHLNMKRLRKSYSYEVALYKKWMKGGTL